jgi:glycosyltransferase involved in cell wall biosynthesis
MAISGDQPPPTPMPPHPGQVAGRAPRLCYVVSSEMTVSAFLKDHIAAAVAAGYQVSVVANVSDERFLQRLGLAVSFRSVPIVRQVSPWRDVQALLQLVRIFRAGCFDIVHSVSPKAGMLAMLAASITAVPHRIHTFTGQVWVTRHGLKRWLLKTADRLLAALTTRALVDSPSQRDFLIAEGVVDADKTEVIGKGSICGVDAERFRPDPDARSEVRGALGIPRGAPVLLFLGRLNRDKGVLELAAAFAGLAVAHPDVHLLVVGPDEEGLAGEMLGACSSVRDRLHRVDYTSAPERFMAAADVFCLPSHREGFGTVIIEAAAAGVPAVASRIYGLTDAVVDGQTGLLHPPGEVEAIARRLASLLSDPERRLTMGGLARQRALADFSCAVSSRGLLAFYGRLGA